MTGISAESAEEGWANQTEVYWGCPRIRLCTMMYNPPNTSGPPPPPPHSRAQQCGFISQQPYGGTAWHRCPHLPGKTEIKDSLLDQTSVRIWKPCSTPGLALASVSVAAKSCFSRIPGEPLQRGPPAACV
jgi:hypothetical protein